MRRTMIELKAEKVGWFRFASAYVAGEIGFWIAFGVIVSIGIFANIFAAIVGAIAFFLIFFLLTKQKTIYKCLDCKKRFDGDNFEEVNE